MVTLASEPLILPSVQASAQSALEMGWSLLLPTADERARTLSTLLPVSSSGELVSWPLKPDLYLIHTNPILCFAQSIIHLQILDA